MKKLTTESPSSASEAAAASSKDDKADDKGAAAAAAPQSAPAASVESHKLDTPPKVETSKSEPTVIQGQSPVVVKDETGGKESSKPKEAPSTSKSDALPGVDWFKRATSLTNGMH